MECNLRSLTLQSNKDFVRLFPVNDEMETKAEQTEDKYHSHPRYLVLSHAETRFAISCLRGKSEFYPFFDDGIHLIKFTPQGFREAYKNGSKWEDFWFTFPGEILAGYLERALSMAPKSEESKDFSWDVHPKNLTDAREKYAPKVEWSYADPSVKDKLDEDAANPLQTGLTNCLASLTRIATNHSDGIPCVIRISFDERPQEGIPCSYFWKIVATDRLTGKVYNVLVGGIIAHKNRDNSEDYAALPWYERPITGYEYSTHT